MDADGSRNGIQWPLPMLSHATVNTWAPLDPAVLDTAIITCSHSPSHLSIIPQVCHVSVWKILTRKPQKHIDFINNVFFFNRKYSSKVHVFIQVVLLFWNLPFGLLSSWQIFETYMTLSLGRRLCSNPNCQLDRESAIFVSHSSRACTLIIQYLWAYITLLLFPVLFWLVSCLQCGKNSPLLLYTHIIKSLHLLVKQAFIEELLYARQNIRHLDSDGKRLNTTF